MLNHQPNLMKYKIMETGVCMRVSTYGLFLAVVFMRPDMQLQGSGSELVEDRSQLEAVLKQRHPGEDVQTQSGS